jgi:hypothetical protein
MMVNQISPWIYLNTSTIELMRDISDANQKLMNLASTIAMEESFAVNVAMDNGVGTTRVHQRVLFMAKFPDWGEVGSEESLSG